MVFLQRSKIEWLSALEAAQVPCSSINNIAEVFAVMAYARQHTFQVLTKRPERMRQFVERAKEAGAKIVESDDERLQKIFDQHRGDQYDHTLLFPVLVDLMAAVPSVVYGLWGVFVLVPWLRTGVEPTLARVRLR